MESNNEECGQRERNIRRIRTKERKHEKSLQKEKKKRETKENMRKIKLEVLNREIFG